MKTKSIYTALTAALAIILLLSTLLTGCGGKEASAETQPAQNAAPEEQAANASPAEAQEPALRNGERYDAVIFLEGMEETVHYEHIRNESAGFEMDYEYELFDRTSAADGEYLVSVYDLPESPENWLEVSRRAEDAETAAAAIAEELSKEYEIIREAYELAGAGTCIRIDASEAAGHGGTPDELQEVYIIPAGNGCIVAEAHFGFESAEGFGRRFSQMLNTLTLLEG